MVGVLGHMVNFREPGRRGGRRILGNIRKGVLKSLHLFLIHNQSNEFKPREYLHDSSTQIRKTNRIGSAQTYFYLHYSTSYRTLIEPKVTFKMCSQSGNSVFSE